jgi:hypothetical protein
MVRSKKPFRQRSLPVIEKEQMWRRMTACYDRQKVLRMIETKGYAGLNDSEPKAQKSLPGNPGEK